MNIEEDIKNLKTYIELVIEKNYCDCNELNTICYGKYGDGSKNVAKSIENVLTAYEKEKGENVKLRLQDIPLMEGEVKAYKDRVNELKQELEKEKEKNKELENDFKDIAKKYKEAESVKFWYNYIHKDKIRKMLQELEDRRNKQFVIGYWSKKAMLEKLLKEE